MEAKDRYYIDSGFDQDGDRHCDCEGWFVDAQGNHRPVLREYKISKPSLGGPQINIPEYFSAYGYYSGLNVSPFHTYTLNDDKVLLSSRPINQALRNKDFSNKAIVKRVRQLDSLISCFTLKKTLTVYRGIALNLDPFSISMLSLQPGDIYEDLGFMSTSHAPKRAATFALGGDTAAMIMEIDLPRGTHCAPLLESNKSAKEEEYEILVERGSRFLVEKKIVKHDHGVYLIYFYQHTKLVMKKAKPHL